MSATPKKRVNKTKEQLVEKIIDQNIEKFKAGLQELEVKYGYRLEPVMYYSKMGAFPQIEVQKAVETKKDSVV